MLCISVDSLHCFQETPRSPHCQLGSRLVKGTDHPRCSLDLAAKEAPGWQAICSRRRRRRKQAVTSWLQTLDTDFPTPGSLTYTICYPYAVYSLHSSQNNPSLHLSIYSVILWNVCIMSKYELLCDVLPYDVVCWHWCFVSRVYMDACIDRFVPRYDDIYV
jgi:hypothetical protein